MTTTTMQRRPSREVSSINTTRRDEADQMLRDMAYVLQLTQRVKNQILDERVEDRTVRVGS